MTRYSACDGRYLSLAQQRRAWEELNRIFGEKTPTPVPPGPDPGPDPPDPDPMSYECVFVDSTTSWMDHRLEPYIINVEVRPGKWRYGFELPPNICLTLFTRPIGPVSFSPGLRHYRNGKPYKHYVMGVEVPANVKGLLESVGYDPETRRYHYFCMYAAQDHSMHLDTEPLQDGDSVVLEPVAFSLVLAYQWYIMFSTWHPRL